MGPVYVDPEIFEAHPELREIAHRWLNDAKAMSESLRETLEAKVKSWENNDMDPPWINGPNYPPPWEERSMEDCSTNCVKENRIGWFDIHKEIFERNPKALMHVLSHVAVFDARGQYHTEAVRFLGFSDLFEPWSKDIDPPKYIMERLGESQIHARRA